MVNGLDSFRDAFSGSDKTRRLWTTEPPDLDPPDGLDPIPDANPQLASIPFVLGQITVIGGTPGVGKSSLVNQLAFTAVWQGAEGLRQWNVELQPVQIWRKQLARHSGVPSNLIPADDKDFNEPLRKAYLQLQAIADDIEFLPDSCGLRQIYDHSYSGDLLVIDYVQRLRVEGTNDARARIDTIMARVRELAKQGVAVVLVSSLSRGRTGLDAFRESSEIEFGADDCYIMEKTGVDTVKLTHLKNRWGPLRDVHLSVDWPTMTFSDCVAGAAVSPPKVWTPERRGTA